MIIFQVLIYSIIAVTLYNIIQRYRYRRVLSKIPSPPGHWLLENMDFLLKNPDHVAIFKYLRDLAEKYYPIYRLSSPFMVAIGILHPGDFEIVLSQMKHLTKGRIYKLLENWLGEGLLTSDGSKWQRRRKLLTQSFHFNILQQYLKIFNEEIDNLIKQIEDINSSRGTIDSIGITALITNMTLQSMAETSMGIRNIEKRTVQSYRHNIYKMGHFLLQRVIKPWRRISLIYYWLTKDGREEKATISKLHEFTYRVIKEREEFILNEKYEKSTSTTYSGRKHMKMLDLLLAEKINENGIDYEGIREEVDTFMFEGHDTTSSAIAFLLYSLAKHPNIQDEARREVFEVLGPHVIPSYNDLQKLTYTERVIKETLRLYPSVPFISRVSSEDFITHTGYLIPKGTILQLHIFDLHRNPEIYPDPHKFDPDRFLPENSNDRHPFAYLPFSGGPRNCIGQKFAILEIKAAISGILRKFRLEDDPSNKLNFMSDLILRLDDDIKIKCVPI